MTEDVVRRVRALGDIEILKSYFLLVWSEWDIPHRNHIGYGEMERSIREDFGGIGMDPHRKDLIKRLDYILERMDRGPGYLKQHKGWFNKNMFQHTKKRYRDLKEVLLEVDRKAMEILIKSHSTFVCALPLPCP
ncbi:hypothetical protein BDM02DRAFT_3116806 [Thelephora ganbajun]|uniref:Uncharacterized protein n=1 Tax=Thelephora ganbajun TaxID=370292 RepID=A0ACB6ZD84_THEGA|nr:hypothetical protein BDM02DRAFT_3116806 [Thelephora ganbajun]